MSFLTNYLFPKNPYLETNANGNYTFATVSKAQTDAELLTNGALTPENRAKAYQIVKAANELNASRSDNAARQTAGLGAPSDGMLGAIDRINAHVPELVKKYDVRIATCGDYLRKAAYVAVPLAMAAALFANETGYIPHSYLAAEPRNSTLSAALNATSGLARSTAVKAAVASLGWPVTFAAAGLLFCGALAVRELVNRCLSK